MTFKQQVSGRQASYKMFWFEALHVDLPPIAIPVENLQMSQNFSPHYNSEAVYGRMDPILTYQNTSRTMSIQFSCQAHHMLDGPLGVVNNIRNLNLLTQLLYPAYQNVAANQHTPLAILKSPPFFKITYGNYVGSFEPTGEILGSEGGLTGVIENFSHELGEIPRNAAMAPLKKKMGKAGEPRYRVVPREIKVSFQFQVIHDKLVGWYDSAFSPGGYGSNFPYNAGNFDAHATKPGSANGSGGGVTGNAQQAAAKGEAVEKPATAPKTPTEKANSSTGAIAKVSGAASKKVLGN
tara:strand:- start:1956 stop:2837 length:882 start_codon:yes stop_codon:yes gene_type:complete